MSNIIHLIDDVKLGKNIRGLTQRVMLMGFKVKQEDVKYSHTSKTLVCNQVYVIEIKGLSRFKKLTSEEIFYLDKNLKCGLSAIIIRKFLGITLWKQIILGDF